MEIELRVVLLGVGLLILLIVAFDFYKRKPVKAVVQDTGPVYPTMMSEGTILESELEIGPEIIEEVVEQILDQPEPEPESMVTNIITITIMSRDPYGFSGELVLNSLQGAELEFGKNDIFDRVVDDEVIFSVANAVEPGYFYIETLPDEHVPGLTMILLPEKLSNPLAAFDKFIRTAKQLAFALNGELLDHQRQPLNLATIEQYRKQVQSV